jgi:hypothetical protein
MKRQFVRKDVEAIVDAIAKTEAKTEAQFEALSAKTEAQSAQIEAQSAQIEAQSAKIEFVRKDVEALSNTTTKARYIGYCTLLLVSLVPKNLEVTRFGDIWNYLGHVMKGQVFEKTVAPLALIFAIVGIVSGGQSIVLVWRVLRFVKPDSVLKFLKIPVGPK